MFNQIITSEKETKDLVAALIRNIHKNSLITISGNTEGKVLGNCQVTLYRDAGLIYVNGLCIDQEEENEYEDQYIINLNELTDYFIEDYGEWICITLSYNNQDTVCIDLE